MSGLAGRWFFVGFFGLFAPIFLSAEEISWDKSQRLPVRQFITDCRLFLSPQDGLKGEDHDSLGIVLSESHDMEVIRRRLVEVVSTRGLDILQGSTFYFTGSPMGRGSDRLLKEQLGALVEELGIHGARIDVFSVPRAKTSRLRERLVNGWQKFKYFFPSLTRDVQAPLWSEWKAATGVTLAIEAPNMVFIALKGYWGDIPAVDAGAVLGVHLATLQLYDVYTKSIVNWLLRRYQENPESVMRGFRLHARDFLNRHKLSVIAKLFDEPLPGMPSPRILFSRQLLLSLPFIVNYTLLGQFTKIKDFALANGILGTFAEGLARSPEFFATHSVTMIMQTLFYKNVITEGIDGWANQQEGVERATAARSVRIWARMPFLALDALALALSTQLGGDPLVSLGPMNITLGHMALAALIWGGSRVTRTIVDSEGQSRPPAFLERFLSWFLQRNRRPSGQ